MAIIPNSQKTFSVNEGVNTVYGGSASMKALSQWYTMQDITDTVRPYKVYTALLTQSGGDGPSLGYGDEMFTIGVTYTITANPDNYDLTIYGAPDNNVGTSFVSNQTTVLPYTTSLEFEYNTGAPVATVLENTLDEDITYLYNGVGYYSILTPNNTFTANKTYSVLQLWADEGASPRLGFIERASTTELSLILTDMNGNPSDNLGGPQNPVYFLTSIEIRVYN